MSLASFLLLTISGGEFLSAVSNTLLLLMLLYAVVYQPIFINKLKQVLLVARAVFR